MLLLDDPFQGADRVAGALPSSPAAVSAAKSAICGSSRVRIRFTATTPP
jgi:hypothetical protein